MQIPSPCMFNLSSGDPFHQFSSNSGSLTTLALIIAHIPFLRPSFYSFLSPWPALCCCSVCVVFIPTASTTSTKLHLKVPSGKGFNPVIFPDSQHAKLRVCYI